MQSNQVKNNVNQQLTGLTICKISFSKDYSGGLAFLGQVSERQTMQRPKKSLPCKELLFGPSIIKLPVEIQRST